MLTRELTAFVGLLLVACNDPGAGVAAHCVEGQSVACACANGGTGAQACGADGVFGACVCEASGDDATVGDTSADDASVSDSATEAETQTTIDEDTTTADDVATTTATDIAATSLSEVADTTVSDAAANDCGLVIQCAEGDAVALVGSYVLVAQVRDDHGHDCGPLEHTVVVTPTEALYIELLWHTPSDINESDTGLTFDGQSVGTDVDLHLLDPGATGYFDEGHDCYWLAMSPNWGGAGELDDPTMLRDDADGAGPEVIAFYQPQSNATYIVGVHYWDDWSFGQSFASVRVFSFGALKGEWDDVLLKHHDMWDVFEMKWPDATVSRIGDDTPSIRANYPIPF